MPRYTMRGIGPPHPKQQEIMSYLLTPQREVVKNVDVMCGRMFGKSTFSIDFTTRVLSLDGKQRLLFLEPDKNRMEKTFLAEWTKIVPQELYHLNYGKREIVWRRTGSILYYGHRDIRGNPAIRANMYRGLNLTGVIDDEAAEGFHREQQQNTFNCIRVASDVMFYLTISTPQIGPYSRFIKLPGHKLYTGTSYDNIYISKEIVDRMCENMGRDQVRREIYGELVALEGRIFREALIDGGQEGQHDIANKWPIGNVNWDLPRYDPTKPYWLFCDLGSATGAFIVVQQMSSGGRFRGPVWTAVADYCPDNDASASRAFQLMRQHFGTPAAIVAGGDIQTRATTDGRTVSYYANTVFGPGVRVVPANESRGNKMLQLDLMNYLIKSSVDHRRFTVARDFQCLDTDSRRGVKEALLEYVHKPLEEREDAYVTPKGAKYPLCHVADALLMGALEVMAPPRYLKQKELPA